MPLESSRADLLDRAVHALAQARSVVLLGNMGIGKSYLLRRIITELRDEDCVVTVVRASPASRTIPFGALAGFVTGGDNVDRLSMLNAATKTLAELPQGRRHVIAVDDAPLLDDQSIAVLDRLTAEHDVPILATVRSSDPRPAALDALWRAVETDVIEVGRLPADAAAMLVRGILDIDDDTQHDTQHDEVAAIVERGAGNPLFLGELARSRNDGLDGLPVKLRELVAQRIEGLGTELRSQLSMVAAADPLDTRLDIVHTDAITVLERRNLVVTTEEEGTVVARPAHPLFGEVMRAGLGAIERLALVRSVADALARLGGEQRHRGDSLRLANWLLDTGDRPDAPLAAAAAREALWWHDIERARTLARIAVDDDPSADHLYMAGDIARLTGEIDDSLVWWHQALEIADNDHDLARISMAMSQVHAWFRNEAELAVTVLNDTADRMTGSVNRLELRAEATLFASLLGRYDDVVTAAQSILDHPDANDGALWTALSNVTWAEAQLIQLNRFEERLQRIHEVRPRLGPERSGEVDLVDSVIVSTLMEQGRFIDAHAHVASVDAAHRPIGVTLFSHAQVALLEGNVDTAVAIAERSMEELAAYDPFNCSPLSASVAAMCLCASQRAGDAARVLKESREVVIDINGVWESIWFVRTDAWIAHANGDTTAAIDACRTSIQRAHESGHDGWAQLTLTDALLFGAIGPEEESRAVIAMARDRRGAQSDAPLVAALTDGAIALVDGDLDAVDDAIDTLGKFGAVFPSAALLCRSTAIARSDVDAHRRATVARLLVDANRLRPVTEFGLSDRQFEVARLAAAGTASKDIADQLFLSVRTVDNHLRAAYRTLDIGTRTDLAALFKL